MFKKIDCVLVRTDEDALMDSEADAADYFRDLFQLTPQLDDDEVLPDIFGLPQMVVNDDDGQILLHSNPLLPARLNVNFLVEDVYMAIDVLEARNCHVVAGPYEIPVGKCAIFKDPFGALYTILDYTRGLHLNTATD